MLKKANKNIAKCTKGQAMREWLVYSADAITSYATKNAYSNTDSIADLAEQINTGKLATDVVHSYDTLLLYMLTDMGVTDTSYLTDYGSTISIRDGWCKALGNIIANMED